MVLHPVAGLNFNTNCLDIRLTRAAAAVTADVAPQTRYMPVTNRLTGGTADRWTASLARQDAGVILTGQIRASSTEPANVSVNEPTLLFGRVLAERLLRAGIQFAGRIEPRQVVGADRRLPAEAKVIDVHTTSLAAAMARTNKRSLNLGAECLLLRSAAAAEPGAGFDEGTALGTAVLINGYGLDPEGFTLADGCGLSRGNRLSPAELVKLLAHLASGPNAATFLQSLSVAGQDGTLSKRLEAHTGRILGKTGSLDGVTTMAGYVLDGDGHPAVAFAIFCNKVQGGNPLAKDVQEALVEDWLAAVDAAAAAQPQTQPK